MFLKSFHTELQENGLSTAGRMTHQIQAPWHQAHTKRMLQCNSTISTANKSRLPPNGVAVLPAFYPLLFLLFKVMQSTRAVLHKYLSTFPGTPGSTKPKWQWRAQTSFLSSKRAPTGTRGWHLLQQGWTQAPMVPAALGRAPGNSNPVLTGGQFSAELGTETAPFHIPIGGSNIPFNACCPAATVPWMYHGLWGATSSIISPFLTLTC